MSKIYAVSAKKTGKTRLVRAKTMAAAVRFMANEVFVARAATHDEIYEASKKADQILNAVAPEQTDIDDPIESVTQAVDAAAEKPHVG